MIDFNFNDDLDANSAKPAKLDLVKHAHVANGGERLDAVSCMKCGGSGNTRWGKCFRCDGRGQISKRSAAASKGAQTARANLADKKAATYASPEFAYIRKRAAKGSSFYLSFLDKIEIYGSLTENQLAVVHKDMAKDAEFYAARAATAPKVEMSAIEALFATATDNDIKRPVFRADGLEISKASATGRNPGALYVKAGGEYAGKIVGGQFHKASSAPADTFAKLQAVAADPLAESLKYARRTGACGLCGRDLVDPVSIRSGIGPVCAENWGLEWKRDAASDELAEEGK